MYLVQSVLSDLPVIMLTCPGDLEPLQPQLFKIKIRVYMCVCYHFFCSKTLIVGTFGTALKHTSRQFKQDLVPTKYILELEAETRTSHYANTPMQHTAIFHGFKNDNFQLKNFAYFHIFAQNIDCGYTLEPPH